MIKHALGRTMLAVGIIVFALLGTYSLAQGVLAQDPPPTRNTPTPTVPPRFTPTPTGSVSPTSELTPPSRLTPTPTRTAPARTTPTPTPLPTTEQSPSTPCYVVRGQLANLTGDPASSAHVLLAGNGWAMEREIDTEGNYAFECLGEGIGLLNPVLPSGYTSLTSDVAVRTGYRPTWHINLGYYTGTLVLPPSLPLSLTAEPQTAVPGERVMLTFTIRNATSQSLIAPWMTMLLPNGLRFQDVTAAPDAFEVWQNLLTVNLGELPPGQETTVQIAIQVNQENPPDADWKLISSFGHQDGMTLQTSPLVLKIVGAAPPQVLPVTGAER